MTTAIDIPKDERGVIRVFSLSMTEAEAQALQGDPAKTAAALGAPLPLAGAHVEVFPLSDLTGVGLVGYLSDGGGVPAEALAADRARLGALEGWVLVLYSLAFQDAAMTLHPAPALTLIGTYGERRVDYTPDGSLTADSAGATYGPAPTRKRSDAAMSGMVATIVLILLGLFTWLLIWIAG